VSYEAAVDPVIASMPMLAICAYDIGAIGDEGIADLHSVHPARRVPDDEPPGFSVHFASDGTVAVEGEIEYSDEARFARAITLATATGPADLCVDLRSLRFIGAGPLTALAESVGDQHITGRQVKIVNAPPIVHRCWEALDLDPALLDRN
jgi:anti-anti-sigma regulatory factor